MIELFDIEWSVCRSIRAVTTLRTGGMSEHPYSSLNPADHVGDDPKKVEINRKRIHQGLNLPGEPKWLVQTHSTTIISTDQYKPGVLADGCFTTEPGTVCAVLTADCLPVFIADENAGCVAVIHAGWRGLVDGILEKAVNTMKDHSRNLVAALGPAISQASFEVGQEVKQQFESNMPDVEQYFLASKRSGHYYADLYGMAKLSLNRLGIDSVWMPESVCTYKNAEQFFSYRRDGQTGRMASFIWMQPK